MHHTDKYKDLLKYLSPIIKDGLLVAYSGGVDSSFLLFATYEAHGALQKKGIQGRLLAVTTNSASIPQKELNQASSFAKKIQVEHKIVDSHEIDQELYAKNDHNRCYHCKNELFRILNKISEDESFKHIAYGYTFSDRGENRPGHNSAKENNILSPLDELCFTKDEIRTELKLRGLNIADKPSSPCLASRLMTGCRVTNEKLQDIEAMESILQKAGCKIFRVRYHEENNRIIKKSVKYFRIEVQEKDMLKVIKIKNDLLNKAHQKGYRWVTLDLNGYLTGGANL